MEHLTSQVFPRPHLNKTLLQVVSTGTLKPDPLLLLAIWPRVTGGRDHTEYNFVSFVFHTVKGPGIPVALFGLIFTEGINHPDQTYTSIREHNLRGSKYAVSHSLVDYKKEITVVISPHVKF